MHHVVAAGRPLDRRGARPADAAPRAAFAWGRGSEGQLGVRGFDDSAAPLLVEGLKGRSVLQARRRHLPFFLPVFLFSSFQSILVLLDRFLMDGTGL
jgi:hypothetical protein